MTDDNDDSGVTRRRYLTVAGAGTVGVTGLSGCLGGDDEESGEDSSDDEDDSGDETTADGDDSTEYETLEVQHWWTGGDGEKAVQSLFDGFAEAYPEIEVDQNPVSGGAGENLETVIKKRVLNDDPPSSWQAWPGKNLQPYVEADKLADIGESVWSANDMKGAYLDGPKDAAKPDGSFVAVPINIHRLNNLFYNVSVVEEADVDPASIESPSDLLDAMQTVEENTDAVGMAHQTKSGWSTGQLWAQVLLGEYGEEVYTAFTDGEVEANEEAVKDSLRIVADYQEYFNDDAGSVSWTEANQKIIKGEAAFFHQGDWAAGMYREQDDFEFGDDWDQVAFPGTEGIYALNMDSFPFPKNNPSPEATKKFLQYCGSADAQERFNPKKGSIPPRTDVPKDEFGPFLSRQMDDFADSDAQVPSIQHGLAIAPDPLNNFGEAMSSFVSEWDVDEAYDGLTRAFN